MRLASLGLGRFFFPQRCLAGFFSWRDLWRDFYCKKHHIPWMINGPPLKVYFKLYPVLKLILTSICYCIIKLSISSSLCSTLQTWMIVLHRRSLRYLNLRFWGHFFLLHPVVVTTTSIIKKGQDLNLVIWGYDGSEVPRSTNRANPP